MQTKTKTIIAVLVIFIFTIVIGAFYYRAKSKNNDIKKAEILINQQNPKEEPMKKNQEESKTETATIVSSGVITSIKEKVLDVKAEKENQSFNITDKTSFYSMKDGKVEIKSFADLKTGLKITFEYDSKTMELLAVKIVK